MFLELSIAYVLRDKYSFFKYNMTSATVHVCKTNKVFDELFKRIAGWIDWMCEFFIGLAIAIECNVYDWRGA